MQKKVLLIDDDSAFLKFLKNILSNENLKVLTALSGAEGYKMFQQFLPQMLFLDLYLPDIPGIEILKKIRAEEKYNSTFITIITVCNEIDVLEEAFAAGANDYITKTKDVRELIARVRAGFKIQNLLEKLVENEKKLTVLQMIGSIAHSLNQPMTGILGYTDILLQEKKLKPFYKELNGIRELTLKMKEIIEHLLNINKLELTKYINNIKILKVIEQKNNE